MLLEVLDVPLEAVARQSVRRDVAVHDRDRVAQGAEGAEGAAVGVLGDVGVRQAAEDRGRELEHEVRAPSGG